MIVDTAIVTDTKVEHFERSPLVQKSRAKPALRNIFEGGPCAVDFCHFELTRVQCFGVPLPTIKNILFLPLLLAKRIDTAPTRCRRSLCWRNHHDTRRFHPKKRACMA